MPRAASLAAVLKKKFQVNPEMIKGGGGEFIVRVDGQEIFSKKQEGRFPEESEIVQAIQRLK